MQKRKKQKGEPMAKYVDLSERVTATFYDQEYEEWTQQTVTIADVLDSVCDDYTVLSSAQPEQTKMIKEIRKWINSGNRGSADYFIVDKIEEIINNYE